MWRWLFALLLVAGVALGAVFGALNPDPASLSLFGWTWDSTLGTVATAAFAAGVAAGCVAMLLLRLVGGRRGRGVPSTGEHTGRSQRLASDG